jgi:hypothetical protein
MSALPAVAVQTEFVGFDGGLDVVTPPLKIPAGFVRRAQNYEQDINGGYRRCLGYERYSGKTRPSAANYAVLTVTLSATPALGETITGGTSAATGVLVATASGLLILTATTGTFGSENISGSSTGALGTCVGPAITDGAATTVLHAQYKNAAADHYRTLIAAPVGSGSILGMCFISDTLYCWRNNAGGTAADMWKATTSGWTAVSLGEEVAFTNANTGMAEGDTLTQGGVTATIRRVVLQTGSLASGVNSGRFIISGRAGGNFAAGAATDGGAGAVTLSGAQTAITLSPSGRFECVNYNFGGSANTKRVYGCDGVNRAFEFDGTYFVPIATGMVSDAPSHITAHKGYLFLSFGGSVQHSSPNDPYRWSVIVGAGEIAVGDTITGFITQPGGETAAALAVLTRNTTAMLYGSGVTDWQLNPFKEEAGAYGFTIQRIGGTIMFDDRGIVSLATSQAFGNFEDATLSTLVQTYLKERRSTVTASCISRDKNQYRLFFSDGSALYATFKNGKVVGMMPQFMTDEARCAISVENSSGAEEIYFGSDDGFVYQMEKGTSFDGDSIEAYLYFVFNASGNVRQMRSYRKAVFEMAGEGYAQFNVSFELGYGSTEYSQPGSTTMDASLLSTGRWDVGSWDQGVWDGTQLQPGYFELTGTAENISLVITSNSDYYDSTKLSGVTLQYTPRRRLR